ncbi:MAG TPA: acylphosphatase [Bacteroidia bacterium]|jgi:acylphosphatase|nr:acylphosphatase [Bacteroidia bacterium]
MVKHLNIWIYGRVQGVFYRATAVEIAISLGIKGFARNENDGTVYIEAEGEEANLKKFVDWCNEGPPRASVERVTTEESEMKNYSNFVIQR